MEHKTNTRYGKVVKRRQKRRSTPYQNQNQNRPTNRSSSRVKGVIGSAGFSIPNLPFFGERIRKVLPYYTYGTLTTAASQQTATAYVLSANGLFDPDITGTGGQPMSFDQAMLFFNHYTCHNSRIRVVFKNNITNNRPSVGVFISGSSTTTTSVEQLIENGDGAFQELEYAGTQSGAATFTARVDAGRFQTAHDVMDDPNMRGDSASNPTEQVYYHLVAWNSSNAVSLTVDFQVLVEYDATFHEPRKGSLS